MYYNTIFLNASSSSPTFWTAGVWSNSNIQLDMRNNIIANVSIPGSSGYTVAYWRSSNNLTTYSSLSNNNCFYAGTPSSNYLIYYDETNSLQTLAQYKTFVAPRDSVSISENPLFVNVTTTPYDLHLTNCAQNTLCESGGQVIDSPLVITTDYDGQPRFPNAGYPICSTYTPLNPDIGADEFGGKGILTGNIKPVENFPDKFALYQNYPNPFNPKTRIKYDVAEVRNQKLEVRLIIYDILGKEIATLVNDNQQAGTYKVEWDGTNYASGVYFYELLISDPETSSGFRFNETKKLVLLK